MSKYYKFILLFFCGFAITFSPAQPIKRTEVPMEINIGVGPAFHHLPKELIGDAFFIGGFALELYAVIPPAVLKEHRDKVPAQYRKYISLDQEMFLRPFWLSLIPHRLIVHPTKELEVWGANWSFFSWAWNAQITDALKVQAKILLPNISYLQVESPVIEKDKIRLWALGLAPALNITWNPLKFLHINASWEHQLYLPLTLNKYKPKEANRLALTQHGIASLVFHWRIPSSAKI